MSKNRLVSSNNAITILENGNPRALTPRLNFEGDIAVVTNDNGQATVKFEVPKNQISEDLLDDLVNLKLTNYIPCCVNSGTVDENGYADFLKQVATQSEFIWNQPVLTEDGDITVNEFVVASPTEVVDKEIYKMFDGSTSTVGCFQENANITDSYFDMYFKDPLKISALQITLPTDEYVTSIKVQASVDGINYTDLATFSALSTVAANICNLSANLRFFHYYRVVGLSANGSYSIAEMKIIGTCLKTIVSKGFNPNYNISGTSITVNDEGIASGFANDSVLTTNKSISFGSNSWEFKTKFRLTANNVDTRILGNYHFSPTIGLSNNKFAIWLSSNGTSWDLASSTAPAVTGDGTVTLQNNTDYYVKFGWNKTQYYVQYSIDDVSYITDWTLASTTPITDVDSPFSLPLGSIFNTMCPLTGTIDLKETYIKVNDKIVWDCTSTETTISFSDNFTRNATYATNRNSIIDDGNGWQAYSSNAQAGIGIANNQLQIYTDNNLASAMYRRSLEDYQNYNSLILEANYQLLSARAVGNQQTSFALGIDNVLAPAYSTTDVNYVFGSGLEVVVSPGTQSVYLYNNGEVLDTATVEILVNSVYKLKVEVTPAKIEVRFWLSTLGEPIDATISSNTGWSTAGKYFAIAQNNSATVAFDTSITNLSIAITKMIGLDNTQSWIQPILTSDLSEGLVEATSYKEGCNPYKALDGIKSGTTDQSNCFVFDNATTGFWKWTLPYTVTITGINFYNIYSPTSGEKIIEGQFFADEEMTIPIGNSFLTSDNDWAMTQIQNIASEGVTTHTIYFNKTGGSAYSGIGELEIFGTINSQNQVFFDTSSNLVLTNANNETVELPFIDSVPVHQHTYLPLIPSMTSYNTPAGTVTGVGGEVSTSYSYWKAFLGNSQPGVASNSWASANSSTLGGPKYTFASPMEPGTYRFRFCTDPYDPTDGQIKSCTVVGIKSDDTEVELWAQLNIQNVATLQTFISPEIEVTEEFATIYFRAEGKWSTNLQLSNCQVYKKDPTGTVAFDNDKIVNIAVNTTTGKAQSIDNLYIQPTKPVLNGYKYNFYNNGATITSDNVLITAPNTKQCVMADKIFDPGDSPWEIKMHFKTPSQWASTGGDLLGMSQEENCKVPNLAWNSDHDFILNLSSTGTSLDIASEVTGTYTYQLNTEYWMKLEFTGTNYIVSYSFNDNDYVNDVTVASTTPIFVDGYNTIAIGNNLYSSSSSESFGGEIYLEDCYFKVGDEIVWRPVTQTTAENNQVYWMDTSVYPYKTYLANNGEFELANDLVWVGQAILENGQIREIKSNPFNFNCTDRKMIECWSKDTSWYKIFLEFDQGVKQIRRWCEQGGFQRWTASFGADTIYFLQPYKDNSSYRVFASIIGLSDAWFSASSTVDQKNASNIAGSIGLVTPESFKMNSAGGHCWKAEGWLD